MAVRDDKQTGTDDQDSRHLPWREALGHVPAVLLIGGLLIYAYLSTCYDHFYGSLGVDPNDVGLTYAGTLARSSGFAILCLFLLAYASGQLLAIQRGDRRLQRRDPTARKPRLPMVLFTVLVGVFVIVIALGVPLVRAGDAAREVQAGWRVGPVRWTPAFWSPSSLLEVRVLAIHADPATVEPAGKPSDSPAAERLRGRKLLYLGQSGGTVVLYDADGQRAVYVPASSIVLHVANCHAKPPPDGACQGG